MNILKEIAEKTKERVAKEKQEKTLDFKKTLKFFITKNCTNKKNCISTYNLCLVKHIFIYYKNWRQQLVKVIRKVGLVCQI